MSEAAQALVGGKDGPELKVRARVRLLDNWQPVLTALLPVLTFVTGIFFSAWQQRASTAQQRDDQWRSALEKVSFAPASLLSTAVLMDSFESDPTYQAHAREIERTVLQMTNEPELFDLVFEDMIHEYKTAEDVNDLMDVGLSLDEDLTNLWAQASTQPAQGGAPRDFQTFLKQPALFFPSEADQAQLKHALVLLWELDTFSSGIACVTSPKGASDCNTVPAGKLQMDGLFLLNYPAPAVPAGGAKPVSYDSCHVTRNPALAGYYMCSAPK